MTTHQRTITKSRGFTIFFAVLVGSLALAIGVSVYELLIRELELSQVARESQFAIYAADAGVECALYWDARYGGTGSAFAKSNNSPDVPSGVTCTSLASGGAHDIAADGWHSSLNVNNPPSLTSVPSSSWNSWHEALTSANGTTTFVILLPHPVSNTVTIASPCAKVTVVKNTPGEGAPHRTTIISRGYNTCTNSGVVRVERAFQVTY